MAASAAEKILVSIVHNGHPFGTPMGFSFERPSEELVIRGAGKIGPTARGEVAGDLIAVVDFLEKGFMTVNDKGSLVITTLTVAGDTVTHTLANMKALAYAAQMNRDAPPVGYRQRLALEDDMDTEKYS